MPRYSHDYDWGALNPWAKKLLGSSIAGGLGVGGGAFQGAFYNAHQIQGYVLYATREMSTRNQYTSSEPTNERTLKQELVKVRVRVPELHNIPVPWGLPPNNDAEALADWEAINSYPEFIAADPKLPLPSPGDIVRVDFRNRQTQEGPIYLGPTLESIRPKPVEVAPAATSENFNPAQPQGTLIDSPHIARNRPGLDFSTLKTTWQSFAEFDGPYPISVPNEIRTVGNGAVSYEITYRGWDPITGFARSYLPLKTSSGTIIEKNLMMHRKKRRDGKATIKRTTDVGSSYPTGVLHPATQVVIHEPSMGLSYPGQKGIRNILLGFKDQYAGTGAGKARPVVRGVAVHYTITNSETGDLEKGAVNAGTGDWHINEHVNPAEWSLRHGGPFNDRSVAIELCRPTYKSGAPDKPDAHAAANTYYLPRWWSPYQSGKHSLWLPQRDMGCFEKLTQLIQELLTNPGLYIPLQFPGVEFPGGSVDLNMDDETNSIPMREYSRAKFHWGNPALEGHRADFYKTNTKHKKAWSQQYAIGNKAQSPPGIVGYNAKAWPAKKHERIIGKHCPTHPQNYSRGIMAHARWAHSDALPAEYYVLMRFMGYSPKESFTLLIEAINGLSDQKNWTILPQAITHGANPGEPPRLRN